MEGPWGLRVRWTQGLRKEVTWGEREGLGEGGDVGCDGGRGQCLGVRGWGSEAEEGR